MHDKRFGGHSGVEAAETRESVAQEGKMTREGQDSRRSSVRHSITLGALDTEVKHY